MVKLANGYYLHQIDFPEKIKFFPGNKINDFFIYDATYPANLNNVTRLFYLSQSAQIIAQDDIIFCQKNNILAELASNPKIILCNEKSLSALFFYYKKFRQKDLDTPIIIIQTNELLPFYPVPSKIIVPQLPGHVIAAVPYFEDLNIPSRIASAHLDNPGWHFGKITELELFKNFLALGFCMRI